MFDPLPSSRQMYERYLLSLVDHDDEADELDDWDDSEERYYREEDDDDEGPSRTWPVWRPTSRPGARKCRAAGSSTGRAPASWCGPPLRVGATHPT